uniref:Uncharacterized protein n=1 Tax=Sphaerodactylus townsendi TaxID=933632 RepID=A0ACB8E8B4_9SAUR
MGLGGAQGSCPTACRCTLEILNCSRITNLPGFHQVPLPNLAAHPHPFMHLDFTGNVISSIGKEVWKAYPWAEHLVLKENSLSRLQSTSLEGLFSLTYLDLSYNKIQIIEKNVFEAVPFLQVINLSGNIIQQITYGTFQAWHGMQFLLKVDLSNNPLVTIQDSYFYGLPSLAYLDLGATDITPRILENLLRTALRLKTLVLPQKMSCCLCLIKEDIEASGRSIKLECTVPCGVSATLCDKEEPLIRMQQEVLKVLQIRKMNSSSLLSILPKRAQPNHGLPQTTKPKNDMLAVAENVPSLTAKDNFLELVQRLMPAKAGEPLNANWIDKGELKKVSMLANLLDTALKERIEELRKDEKIVELEKNNLEAAVLNELSAQASTKATDEAAKQSTNAFHGKERHVENVMRENWLQRNQRQKETLGGDGQGAAEITGESAKEPSVFHLHNSLTNVLKPTGSTVVNNNDNSGNPRAVLQNGSGAQTLTEEEQHNQLPQKNSPPAEDGKSKNSAIDSKRSLNEVSPDITLYHGSYWEHRGTSVSPPLKLALQDDYLLQGDLFEDELDKLLTSLIPNTTMRKLMSHLIRILKMDCTVPQNQKACAKLISKTGLLMKLFSEREKAKETSLRKSYFLPFRNVANATTANSRKLQKPLDKASREVISAYSYGNKLLLAVSATAIIMIIIAVICLIEICLHHYADEDGTFTGQRKESLPDLEASITDSELKGKPLWLKDMHHVEDEIQKGSKVRTLHDEESSDEMDVVSWGDARPSLPEASLKKSSSKALPAPTEKVLPPTPAAASSLAAPSAASQKSIAKKDSKRGTPETTSSKAKSSAATEGLKEEEDSAEKSEAATTEATTELQESSEGEDEESD